MLIPLVANRNLFLGGNWYQTSKTFMLDTNKNYLLKKKVSDEHKQRKMIPKDLQKILFFRRCENFIFRGDILSFIVVKIYIWYY